MKPVELVREAARSALSARVPSVLIALVVAATCGIALTTVGRTAAAEAAVLHTLEDAGSRQLRITDATRQGFLNQRTIDVTRALSSVDVAIGVGTPVDVSNGAIGPGGATAPLWPIHADLSQMSRLIAGRWPRTGEVAVTPQAQHRFGLTAPTGYVLLPTGETLPIVGAVAPDAVFDDLSDGVLLNAAGNDPIRQLRVVINTVGEVAVTQRAVLGILSPADASGVYIESPTGLALLAQGIGGELGRFNRTLLVIILAAGGVLVAAVVLSDTLVRRRDIGRRRTLGASRPVVVGLVTLRAVISAIIGAFLGTVAAVVGETASASPVPIDFAVAVGVEAVLITALASLGPAIAAARREPVEVLRTP